MAVDQIRRVNIDDEMQQSYLDYAMSVIVSRALPDARDGLKPVQRRILYAMYDMGLRADSSYKKSARIVGEVLGKYHPHGDMAVYEAMARMGQDFSLRCLLVDGQGNFGSVDGDPPAAMRYTEARLKAAAVEMLAQIDRETVPFLANFDDTLKEPAVLPAALPNLLVNGATGIAVGMATSIPPHNLGEVIDALNFMLENWERLDDVTVSDLMRFVQGPDFPTGGVILQEDQENNLQALYASGKGKVIVRGQVHLEEMGKGRSRIIITELPYMTNKSTLIERIAELVREGTLEGLSDLRDESDRQGMRIVIELSKAADEEKILRQIYQKTPLQTNLGINLLALVEGEPHLLTLKQALKVFIEHRLTVVQRRSQFDLRRAKERAHILEGLRVAINHLDEVISIIRASSDADQARLRLIKRFKLSEVQAVAILDMPLKRLAALERRKIEQEYKELIGLIKELEGLLKSQRKIRQVVQGELDEIKRKYADRRRTQIISLTGGETARTLLTRSELVPAQPVWACVSADGLILRTREDHLPRLGAVPAFLSRCDTNQTLYLVSESGAAAAVAAHSLPEADDLAQGSPVASVSPFPQGEKVCALISVPQRVASPDTGYMVTLSALGMVKKSNLQDLPGPSGQVFTLARVNQGDRLVWCGLTLGNEELLLLTKRGMGIRFSEEDVRPMGLIAAGVNGVKLAKGDEILSGFVVKKGFTLLALAADGLAWRFDPREFPLQGRYGGGVIACHPGEKNPLAAAAGVSKGKIGYALLKKAGQKPFRLDTVPLVKRAKAGKAAFAVRTGDEVVGLAYPQDSLTEANGGGSETKGGKGAAPRPAAEQLALLDANSDVKSRRRAKTTPALPEHAARKEKRPKKVSSKSSEKTHGKTREGGGVKGPRKATARAAAKGKTAAKSTRGAKPAAMKKGDVLAASSPGKSNSRAPASKSAKPKALTARKISPAKNQVKVQGRRGRPPKAKNKSQGPKVE